MPKILITGFEPFREVTTNPSQLIVEHLAKQNNPDLITEVLPVVYRKAEERIKALLHEHQPVAVMMLGVAQKREEINLERIAVNLDDATIPDNNGRPARGTRIFDDAPVGYWSTLPLESMHAAIKQAEIPVKFSNHAGTFLCNHVFYIARHTLEIASRGSIPCGFIHLPSIETLPIEKQFEAVSKCIETTLEALRIERFKYEVGQILQRLANQLPDKPRWVQLQDAGGVYTAHWGNVEIDRAAAMAAACNALGEPVLTITENGDFRYTLIFGSDGTFLATRLNENQDVLSMNFDTVKSVKNLLTTLKTSLAELHFAIGIEGYDITP